MSTETIVAKVLVEIGAVGFNLEKPFRFKSGILSPIYIDNRILPFYPKQWKKIILGFKNLIKNSEITFDVLAGIEAAGIPHSSTLGYVLEKPSVFARKTLKDHGTKKMIEGGIVRSKKVLLLEDLVTTGMSSLHGVEQIRKEKGIVTDCLAIVSFSLPEAKRAFQKKKVKLHTLTTFHHILEVALKQKLLGENQGDSVYKWLQDPWNWESNHFKTPSK